LTAREEFIDMGPYMAKRRLQQFGGSSPSATGEMRHRPGVMLWSDPASLTPGQKAMLKDRLTKALEMLEGAPTSAAEVMVHAVARREKPTKVVIPKAIREEGDLKKELRLEQEYIQTEVKGGIIRTVNGISVPEPASLHTPLIMGIIDQDYEWMATIGDEATGYKHTYHRKKKR